MRSKRIKWLLLLMLPVLLVVCNSNSVNVSEEDQNYIEAFAKEWHVPTSPDSIHADFATELRFISAAQEAVMRTVQHEEIAHKHFGDMSFYFRQRKGFCYDRAVLMEKFFAHYGFPFRHVYLYFAEKNKSLSALSLFNKNTSSHALVEVKTKNGWMAIGTNADWVGLTTDNEVLNTGTLRERLQKGGLTLRDSVAFGNCFWLEKGASFRYIYGLYSRHGDFFRRSSNVPFSIFGLMPDYDLHMLFSNF